MEECPHCGSEVRPNETCECDTATCAECGDWVAYYELDDWDMCPTCQEEYHAN